MMDTAKNRLMLFVRRPTAAYVEFRTSKGDVLAISVAAGLDCGACAFHGSADGLVLPTPYIVD